MTRILVLIMLAALGGCASPTRLASGDTVKTLMASQVIPPQPHAATGMDGVAAVAAQAHYVRSYVTPTAQADSPTFGKK